MSKIISQKCSKMFLLFVPVLLWALALPIAFAPMQVNIFVSAAYAHVIPGDDEPHTHPHEPETLPRIDLSEFQGPKAPGNIQLGNVHSFTLDAHDRLNTNLFQNNPLLNMPGFGYTAADKAQITTTITGIVLADPALTNMAVDLATGGTTNPETGNEPSNPEDYTSVYNWAKNNVTIGGKPLTDTEAAIYARAYIIGTDSSYLAGSTTDGVTFRTLSHRFGVKAVHTYQSNPQSKIYIDDYGRALINPTSEPNHTRYTLVYDGTTGTVPTGTVPSIPSSNTVPLIGMSPIVSTDNNFLADALPSGAFTQIEYVAANSSQYNSDTVAFAGILVNDLNLKLDTSWQQTPTSSFGSPTEERALVEQFVSKFVDEVFGSPQVASGWSVFLTPYGNFSSSTNGSSHGNTYGLSGGLTHIFNEKFSLGMHFDLGSSQNYADSLSTESRTLTGSLGLNANYKFTPEWYVGASFTASFSNTYNDYATTSSLGWHSANNNHGGSSLAIGLNTGYIIQLNENHALIPEIGLSYVYSHTDANDIEWDNGGSFLNMYNDATSYDALYGNISVRWLGTFEMDENTVFKPFVSVGLRQNLSGHPMESSMVYAGTRYNNEATPDMTTFITTVGMEWVWNNFSVNLNYNGAYGAEKVNHGGGVTFGWSF